MLKVGLMLTAALALLVLLPGAAQAGTYTNATWHYHFTAPDAWYQTNESGGNDVTFESAFFGGALMSAGHAEKAAAESTEVFLLAEATAAHGQFKGLVGGTDVQAPRTFTTGGSRLAADFTVDWTLMSETYRTRQVFFASDGWNMTYVLTFQSNRTDYQNRTSAWDNAVNSFAVDDEPAPPAPEQPPASGGFLPGFDLAVVVAAVGAAGVVAVRSRPRR
ncbi:MAG TPA: hypothetical protein VGB42_07965 [Candidatus Thermoplasmatota archaeon]